MVILYRPGGIVGSISCIRLAFSSHFNPLKKYYSHFSFLFVCSLIEEFYVLLFYFLFLRLSFVDKLHTTFISFWLSNFLYVCVFFYSNFPNETRNKINNPSNLFFFLFNYLIISMCVCVLWIYKFQDFRLNS